MEHKFCVIESYFFHEICIFLLSSGPPVNICCCPELKLLLYEAEDLQPDLLQFSHFLLKCTPQNGFLATLNELYSKSQHW